MPASTLVARPVSPVPAAVFTVRVSPDEFPPSHVRGLSLRPDPRDVGAARRFVREYCTARGIAASVADDVCLCTSEIVANAIRHAKFPPGRCHVFLRIVQRGPFVSVTVFDPDCRPECLARIGRLLAVQRPASLSAESGRGLSLVVRPLACRASVGLGPHGLKRTSFDIDCLPSLST